MIKYSKRRAKTEKDRKENLQRKMQITQTRCVQNPCDELKNIFEECKAELENFYEEKANGLIVRARARWHEYGKKPYKIFFEFGKEKLFQKTHKVVWLSGVITKDYQKILDSSSEYYKNLHSSKLNVTLFLETRTSQCFQKKKD